MSYSTAKKIYGKFRRSNIEKNAMAVEERVTRAAFVEVPQGTARPIPTVCLIAGNHQNR